MATILAIGSAEEYTLPGVRGHAPPEAGAILIVHPGNKGFHLIQVRFLHACQLTDLNDPIPLQFFSRSLVVHVGQVQAVGKPLHAQVGDEGGLADALRAVQHGHIVELDTRMVNAHVGGAQGFAAHRADVGIVLSPQVINQQLSLIHI